MAQESTTKAERDNRSKIEQSSLILCKKGLSLDAAVVGALYTTKANVSRLEFVGSLLYFAPFFSGNS